MDMNMDISEINDIQDIYKISPIKNWIKLIPLNKTILFDIYNRKKYFKPLLDIKLDNDMGTNNIKKRNTLIQFIPKENIEEEINRKTEWIYIFLINKRIVKIGGTRTGIKGRIASYLCGHHIRERGKSGDCSKTNGFIYNTFEFYLQRGCIIEMYGYELPKIELPIEIFDITKIVYPQTYHTYESMFLEDYKKTYLELPILCDNGDPDYRS
jgi:hypothetical protein